MIFFGILLQRVFYLQIVRGADYQESFSLRTEREVSLASTRGNIYDRNGNVLAYSELSWSVTIEDNGSYPNTRTKNAQLNETIYKLIKLIEKNGDSVVSDLGIVYQNGSYEYSLTGTSLLRLKADVFGKSSTSDLDASEELATADELMKYMCSDERYAIKASYTEEEKEEISGQIRTFKEFYDCIQYGDYYRLTSPLSGSCTVWETVAPDASEALVSAVYHHVQANPVPVYVKLRGLEEKASYRLSLVGKEEEMTLSGAALMHAGLPIPPAKGDYCAWQIHLVRI